MDQLQAPLRRLRTVPRPVRTPSLAEIPYGYRPSTSLGLSLCAHLLAFLLIVLISHQTILKAPIVVKPQLEARRSPGEILILPKLGGGHEGTGKAGGGAGASDVPSSGMRAQSRRGFAYPGPQPIISNPPHATLGMQTILQPPLKNLPLLRRYVPLPNIVQPPPAPPEVKQPDIVVKDSKVSFRRPPQKSVAAPKIKLPVSNSQAVESVLASKPELPQEAVPVPAEPEGKAPALVVQNGKLSSQRPAQKAVAAPKIKLPVSDKQAADSIVATKATLPQKAAPTPVEPTVSASVQQEQKGLLVLNAVPDSGARLPRAEERSLFAVAPGDATVIADPAAGTKSGREAAMAASNGNHADVSRGDALAEIASGGKGANPTATSSGTGSGGHHGNGQGTGLNSEAGSGVGHGVASSGSGLGTGSVSGAGTGSGAGSAPGRGGFPGITIQGGRYGNTNVASLAAKVQAGPPKSYNMTIVSTANSGGGLPDVGVFHDEKVYTVYLDMRATQEDPAQSWTMQYAVLQPDDPPGVPVVRVEGTPTPPYATLKEVPKITSDQARKYGRRLIIASAIMNTKGKLEQLAVKQNPDPSLVPSILEALSDWNFEPAKIDGQPVALKVLLGIRLSVPR